ncbi:MAG TPA: metallophosphoesterase, partial [Candidatus Kapabacteria bacterium]|nr:metallophosphoesterase [Candidatus Kapabacteria bacterium]
MENKNININTKLFSIRTLLLATLVGGPIAGCLMLARNFKQLGDNQAARRSIFQGTLAVLFMYAVLLPFIGIRPLQNGLTWGTEIKIILVVSTILKLLFGGFIYFKIPPLLQGLIDHPRYTNEETVEKENWAFIWLIAWFISIGFFAFPFSVGLLVNVTGTLLVLSFYFALFIYSQARKVYQGKFAHLFFVSILSVPFAVSPLAWYGYNRPGPRIFLLVFSYALVAMFYLFLFTVGLNGLLAINRFFKFLPEHLVKSNIARKIGFYLIILCVTALIVNGHYNVVKPRIQTYDIQVPKRHTDLKKLKVVAAADFHLSKITGPHFLKNAVDKINALNPDLVIIAGDITNEKSEVVDWKNYDADFRAIKSKYGVYTVIGNHELQYNPEKTLQFIARSNMRLLQ